MNKLVEILSDGRYHSGQVIGDALGVSRAAVWKQVAGLEKLGVIVESVKGKGYRLHGGETLSLLDGAEIKTSLSDEAQTLLSYLSVNEVLDSTNTALMTDLATGLRSGLVCLAEQQTAGRGRRGREWVSPYAGSIYLSASQVFQTGAAAIEGLSLAVGSVVADVLAETGVDGVQLKWPNDIYWQDKKLAGILLELVGDAAGECAVVVGIGINVDLPNRAGENIDQPWVDMKAASGLSVDRNKVVSLLLNKLLPMLNGYEHNGFEAYRRSWLEKDLLANETIVISMGGNKLAGTAKGVSDRGALLIETALGIQEIHGGEVTVRKSK